LTDGNALTMERQPHAPQTKQLAQVTLATLLVAGTPVAAVWWLRVSGTVESVVITLVLGMAISLLTSWAGRSVWERRQGADDLLFSELMVWGYLRRRRSQRRLSDAAALVAPLSGPAGERGVAGAATVREQTRLLERLVAGMETRDPYLHGHSRRVARHAWMIARRMKLPPEQVARVRTAAALHDVGKTKTPKTILHKSGRLTDEEYSIIKRHPGEGAEMAAVLGDDQLAAMIRHHHERLDGSGYPDGLRGAQIPLGARIIAVADTFDAITSTRPYREARPHRRAIDILHEEAGTRLDPEVVRAFCGHYAGRGPLALWSFVSTLPERVLSWLSASAVTVASAGKVVAVAALVGGVAATSSTLGLAGREEPARARVSRPAHAASARLLLARPGGAAGAVSRAGAQTGRPLHGAGHRRHRSAPGAASVGSSAPALAGYIPAASPPNSAAPAGQTGGGAGSTGGHREEAAEAPGAGEGPATEQPRKPRSEEAPATGKHEEPPAAGKHEEHAAKGKSEEVPAKGKSEESSGHGKTEEPAPTAGAEETAGKGSSGKGGSGKGASKVEAGSPGQSGEAH
jgi:putative nucleotidyltransferase with HDIG domain